MRRLTIFLLLGLLFLANTYSFEKSWFKRYKGSVGNLPATMNIVKYGTEIMGYYYYNKYMQPLRVIGNSHGDSLDLIAYANSYQTENFTGILKKGNYSGDWTMDGKADLKFKFTEDTDLSESFEFVYVYGKKNLIEGIEYPPSVTYTEGVIWPADDYKNSEFLKRSILAEKKIAGNLKSIGDVMLSNKKNFIDNYFRDNKDVTKEEMLQFGQSYSLEEQDLMTIVYLDDNIAVLSDFSYGYTGGAHGNYATGYSTFSLRDKKKIHFDELFTKQGLDEMPKLLEKNFRKQNDVKEGQTLIDAGLFSDTIQLTENFALTPGGIMFSYTPYEIAPYSAGEVAIYITLDELEPYIKPEIKKLLKQ